MNFLFIILWRHSIIYDPVSAYWSFRLLANILFTNPSYWEPTIRDYLMPYEDRLINLQPVIDSVALALYHISKNLAVKFLTSYSESAALGAQELARNTFADLATMMAKISRYPCPSYNTTEANEEDFLTGSGDIIALGT